MAGYRPYMLDDDGHIVDVVEQLCEDDREALNKSRSLVDGRDIGIWSGARTVGRVNKGDAPVDAGDPGFP